jgi:hypothetical protein
MKTAPIKKKEAEIEKKAKQRKATPKKAKRKYARGPIEKKAQPKPKKPKRKYKRGEIAEWVRLPLADSSADEGNDLEEWEAQRFLELCLCGPGTNEATCTCGCMVQYTRSSWRKHKAKHGLAPPGGWDAWP